MSRTNGNPIDRLKYAYEHSVMVSGPEMRAELGQEFDTLIRAIKSEAFAEGVAALSDAPELWPGMKAEPGNPYEED